MKTIIEDVDMASDMYFGYNPRDLECYKVFNIKAKLTEDKNKISLTMSDKNFKEHNKIKKEIIKCIEDDIDSDSRYQHMTMVIHSMVNGIEVLYYDVIEALGQPDHIEEIGDLNVNIDDIKTGYTCSVPIEIRYNLIYELEEFLVVSKFNGGMVTYGEYDDKSDSYEYTLRLIDHKQDWTLLEFDIIRDQ